MGRGLRTFAQMTSGSHAVRALHTGVGDGEGAKAVEPRSKEAEAA